MLEEYLSLKYKDKEDRKRNRDILKLRTGITNGGVTMTLEEIGKKHGLTRERIRQIERGFVNYIRKPKNRERLEGYL